jgi:HK97 family phage major capsid protein
MSQRIEMRKTGPQYRFVSVARDGIDVDKRTVALSFSSEEPYERFFGREILDHVPKSVRLGRLADGGALLLDHTPSRHIGVVERVDIGDDRVGRAVVRFGRSAEAESAFQDVQDGIRKHVSVGYFIHRMVLEEEKDGQETYRVTDWEPFEVSLVAIPADPTVGVGRAAELEVSTAVVREVADQPAATPPTTPRIEMSDTTTQQTPPAGVEAERARVNAIVSLGEQYSKYVAQKDITDAIQQGRSIDQFRETIMSKMESRHTDTSALRIGMERKEVQRYSISRAILASITGNWEGAGLERAASQAVAKMMGKDPEGFFVPFDAFQRDFNVGTSTEAGNLVATDLRTDLYVDALRNAMVLASMGLRILPGLTSSIDIPRKSVASSLGLLTEIGSASETNPNIQKVTLSPKRIGAYVEYSKQALIQSSLALEPMLRDDLITGAAVLLENQVINGAGTGAEIKGIRNVTGIGTVVGGTNGLAPAWSHFVDLESACANANAEPDRLAGYLVNTRLRGKAKQTTKATNLGFIWDNGAQPLNGYRVGVTNNVPANLTKGTSTTICSAGLFGSDYSMAVLGLFGAPDVTVDPYTKADTGQVKITLNQFADMGVRQPACFAKIDDWLAG